jgi:hypothetical protein
MANYRVEVRGWASDSGLEWQGLMALSLLSYVANITILLIRDTILTKKHLGFNLVNQQDKLEFKQGAQFEIAS